MSFHKLLAYPYDIRSRPSELASISYIKSSAEHFDRTINLSQQ